MYISVAYGARALTFYYAGFLAVWTLRTPRSWRFSSPLALSGRTRPKSRHTPRPRLVDRHSQDVNREEREAGISGSYAPRTDSRQPALELSPRSICVLKKGRKVAGVGTGDKQQGCVGEAGGDCVSEEGDHPRLLCNYEVQDPERSVSRSLETTNAIISWRIL